MQWNNDRLSSQSTAALRRNPLITQNEYLAAANEWLMSRAFLVLRAQMIGIPVSHVCAEMGDTKFLFIMHHVGAQGDISWAPVDEWGRVGDNVAHIAVRRGHTSF